jgi:hypothetical protein
VPQQNVGTVLIALVKIEKVPVAIMEVWQSGTKIKILKKMNKQRIFISFDYDNDSDIKTMLAGQAKYPDSPFDFTDASVKEHLTGDWKDKVKRRMRNCNQVVVLCGTKTHTARGVAEEVKIAQEIGIPYFLLAGRSAFVCTKPTTAKSTDKIYKWNWPNLKSLIGGAR